MTLAQRMDEHIQALLFEIGAEYMLHDGGDDFSGCAVIVSGPDGVVRAFISLPKEGYPSVRVAYFSALHEYAHLYQHVSDRGFTVKPWVTTTLGREAHAWSVALRTSRYKPTKQVWRHILVCLVTYAEAAASDRRFKMSLEFNDLLDRARKEAL